VPGITWGSTIPCLENRAQAHASKGRTRQVLKGCFAQMAGKNVLEKEGKKVQTWGARKETDLTQVCRPALKGKAHAHLQEMGY